MAVKALSFSSSEICSRIWKESFRWVLPKVLSFGRLIFDPERDGVFGPVPLLEPERHFSLFTLSDCRDIFGVS